MIYIGSEQEPQKFVYVIAFLLNSVTPLMPYRQIYLL